MNEQLQRFAIAATLGLLLMVMGFTYATWQFWGVLALMIAYNYITYRDAFESGAVASVEAIAAMPEQERNDILQLIKDAAKEEG